MSSDQNFHARGAEFPGYVAPTSKELLDESNEQRAAFVNWMRMAPERRAERIEEQRQKRAAERAGSDRKPITLEALLDKLGFSREYGEHLMQPYCYCDHGHDGWDYCAHAQDEGLRPW